MTEYIASSAFVGRRPRISRMRAYSSGLRPSSSKGCSASGLAAARSTVSYPRAVEETDMGSLERSYRHERMLHEPVLTAPGRPPRGPLGRAHRGTLRQLFGDGGATARTLGPVVRGGLVLAFLLHARGDRRAKVLGTVAPRVDEVLGVRSQARDES